MKTKITLIFILFSSFILSQDLEILYGINYYYSRPVNTQNELLRTHINNTDPFIKTRFAYQLKKKQNISLIASYYTYISFVSVKIGTEEEFANMEEGSRPFINGGSSKTRLHRLGIGIGLKREFLNEIIKIRSRLIFNQEFALETWGPGFGSGGKLGRYDYSLYNYSNPGFQIIPELNIGLNIKIYKGFAITVDYSYLRGFRPNMYSDVTYAIDGILQPVATFYNKGTSHHLMIGTSIKLWK